MEKHLARNGKKKTGQVKTGLPSLACPPVLA